MVVIDLQGYINLHLFADRPIFSIKAVDFEGDQAILPEGKHLRLINCKVKTLIINGGKSAVVLQKTTVDNLIVNPGTLLECTSDCTFQKVSIQGSRINMSFKSANEILVAQTTGFIYDCPSINKFTINDSSVLDFVNVEKIKTLTVSASTLRSTDIKITDIKDIKNSDITITGMEVETIHNVANSRLKLYNTLINNFIGIISNSIIRFQDSEIEKFDGSITKDSEITSKNNSYLKGIGTTITDSTFYSNKDEIKLSISVSSIDNSKILFKNGKFSASSTFASSLKDSTLDIRDMDDFSSSAVFIDSCDASLVSIENLDFSGLSESFCATITSSRLTFDIVSNINTSGSFILSASNGTMVRFINCENFAPINSIIDTVSDSDITFNKVTNVEPGNTMIGSLFNSTFVATMLKNCQPTNFFNTTSNCDIHITDSDVKCTGLTITSSAIELLFSSLEVTNLSLGPTVTGKIINSKVKGINCTFENSSIIIERSVLDYTNHSYIDGSAIRYDSADNINCTSLTISDSYFRYVGGVFTVTGNSTIEGSNIEGIKLNLKGTVSVDDASIIASGSSVDASNLTVKKTLLKCPSIQGTTATLERVNVIGTLKSSTLTAKFTNGQELQLTGVSTLDYISFHKIIAEDTLKVYYGFIGGIDGSDVSTVCSNIGVCKASDHGVVQRSFIGYLEGKPDTAESVICNTNITSGTAQNIIVCKGAGLDNVANSIILGTNITGGATGCVLANCSVSQSSYSLIVYPNSGVGTYNGCFSVGVPDPSGDYTRSVIHCSDSYSGTYANCASLCSIPIQPTVAGIINLIETSIGAKDGINFYSVGEQVHYAHVTPAMSCSCCI
jgi:hypothetical protein